MNIIVSYNRVWGPDGTEYKQTVKIPKHYRGEINMYIQANMDLAEKDKRDWYTLLYLSTLDGDINYTKLTTRDYVKQWLLINDIDVSRWLDRNTIIQFV